MQIVVDVIDSHMYTSQTCGPQNTGLEITRGKQVHWRQFVGQLKVTFNLLVFKFISHMT